MARYHISPSTGRPNKCTAKVQCRYVAEDKHFDSKEAARGEYEKQMAKKTVSESLKKTSKTSPKTVTKKPLFNSQVVAIANTEIERLSNGAVSIQVASDYLGDDSPELLVMFNAEHDLCIVVEEEDGQKVAYSAYGIDPRPKRWPLSEFVTASKIDELAMENEEYHPERWRQEPSPQGQKIARLINAVIARPIDAPIAPKVADKTRAKAAPAASAARKALEVIPGVTPVRSKQELDEEQGELLEMLHGDTVKGLLSFREVNMREIEEAERSGSYIIWAKVPSYSEVAISTDLARRELGFPTLKKTGIDESPLRIAELAKDEAYSKTFGSFRNLEELNTARQNYETARNEFLRFRKEWDDSKEK